MNTIRWLFRIIGLVGLMVITTSIVHVVSVNEVLKVWSAEIDEQEKKYTVRPEDESAKDVIKCLCMYGRVICKFEHLNANWLYKHVMIGLILLFPWSVTTMKGEHDSKT